MKIKTSELSGAALDWAVEVANGHSPLVVPYKNSKGCAVYQADWARREGIRSQPSTNWAQGGPILDRERIATFPELKNWVARIRDKDPLDPWLECFGSTSLVAAMRVFVLSRMGDEIDVPEELLKEATC